MSLDARKGETPYDKDWICKLCGGHANGHFNGDCTKKSDWYGTPMSTDYHSIIDASHIGKGTIIHKFCNIYRSTIGEDCTIASYVEIGGSTVGDNCKIEARVFLPPGTKVGNHVFIGPHTAVTNDKDMLIDDWTLCPVTIEDNVRIGANCSLRAGITIGHGAVVGMGAVVTRDVPAYSEVRGPPARIVELMKHAPRQV